MTRIAFDCLSCPKFMATNKNHPDKGGMCRAHPPVPIIVHIEQTPLGQRPVTMSFYPGVGRNDWCAEHPLAAGLSVIPLLGGAVSAVPPSKGNGTPELEDAIADDDGLSPVGASIGGARPS